MPYDVTRALNTQINQSISQSVSDSQSCWSVGRSSVRPSISLICWGYTFSY